MNMPRWLEQWICGTVIGLVFVSFLGALWSAWQTLAPSLAWAGGCAALAIGGIWALVDDARQKRRQ